MDPSSHDHVFLTHHNSPPPPNHLVHSCVVGFRTVCCRFRLKKGRTVATPEIEAHTHTHKEELFIFISFSSSLLLFFFFLSFFFFFSWVVVPLCAHKNLTQKRESTERTERDTLSCFRTATVPAIVRWCHLTTTIIINHNQWWVTSSCGATDNSNFWG